MIIMETELWPNTVHACAHNGIPVLLANARLSARSARGYARLGNLAAAMLAELTCVAAQNVEDGERFIELGLPRSQLTVTGSIKFDIALDAELIARAQCTKAEWQQGGRIIWIGASTHAGEDEIFLQAHKQLRETCIDALLILVPRHPERFNGVAALIERSGLSYTRRSSATEVTRDTAVLLGDSMGELLFLYGCADIAVVGGSFIERGGHNTLEPAAWGLPIITGASAFNFREIAELLTQASALTIAADGAALTEQLILLAGDPKLRAERGNAGRQVVEKNRGALQKLITEIDRLVNV
jgi:3-deoxy-D-manno-octulosonic-acid transferase